jgi:hypothetical protein
MSAIVGDASTLWLRVVEILAMDNHSVCAAGTALRPALPRALNAAEGTASFARLTKA